MIDIQKIKVELFPPFFMSFVLHFLFSSPSFAYHLTINDRLIIKKSLDIGFSIRQIARVLDRSPSIISREICRYTNSLGKYLPQYAQASYDHTKRGVRMEET